MMALLNYSALCLLPTMCCCSLAAELKWLRLTIAKVCPHVGTPGADDTSWGLDQLLQLLCTELGVCELTLVM